MRVHPAVPRRAARLSRLPLGVASLLAFALTCRDVTVTPVAVRNVEVDPADVTLTVGEERQLTAIVTDDAGHPLDRSVTWSAEDDDIVSVDAETGDVVALRSGETSVTAAVDGRSGTATVIVMDAPGEEEVATVEIDPDEVSLQVGGTIDLEAIARSERGVILAGREVTWLSSDEAVASVDADGAVTGVATGEVTITATIGGIDGAAGVRVTPAIEPVATVEVDPDEVSLEVGGTVELEAIARSAGGVVLSGRQVTWSSSDAAVASVDEDGVVTGLATGDATITATIEGADGMAEVMVAAEAEPVATVGVDPDEVSLEVGGTVEFEAIPRSERGAVLTGRQVTWSSSDPPVASVDEDGVVTGVAAGEATITASIEGVNGTARVTVTAEAEPVATIEVDPGEVDLQVGGTVALQAIARSAGGVVLSGRDLTWSSSDAAVASVDDEGVVTGVAAGAAKITATIDGVNGTADVTVSPLVEPVATVDVDPGEVGLQVGGTVALQAIARSAGGTVLSGRHVTWLSSDAAVASVDDEGVVTGVVTGVAAGAATITATIDGVNGAAEVTVSPVVEPVATVEVNPDEVGLRVGGTVELQAIARSAGGVVLPGHEVTWSSSDAAVASVDGEGVVTGVAAGRATITATTDGVEGTAEVMVTAAVEPVATVEVDPDEASVEVGGTVELEAIARSEDGTVLEGRGVAWSSSDADVASVDDEGVVTGVAAGEATITATIEGNDGTAELTVTPVVSPVATVEVDPAEATVEVDGTVALEAIARSDDDTVLEGREVTWSSSDAEVASVNDEGVVTGVAEGEATITATIEDIAGNAQITVSPVPVATVEVDPAEATIEVGGSVALEATALSDDDTVLEGREATWSSSDAAVASVDEDGVVTGVAEGAATITATIEDIADNAQITVSPVPVVTVEVDPATATIEVGSTVALEAIALSDDDTVLEGREATWSSSDATVASVDGNGVVTGVAEGAATITATIEGVAGNAQITVSPVPVATVDVDPAEASIEVGGTVALEAIALSDDDTVLEGRETTWSSSDAAVASVDAAGVVTGVAQGVATITATIEGVAGNAQITVSPVPVATVEVDPAEASIFADQTVQLNAIPLAANGDPLEGRAVVWESDNTLVATVDQNGLVTAGLPLGFATITATIEGVSGSATITVLLIRVESVELEPAEASIVLGETVQLMARALSESGDVIEGHPVSWQSDNVSVATVDAVGLVKGEAPGEAAIMATIEDKSDIARILVDPVPVESIIVSPASVSMNILSPVNPTVFTAEVSGRNIPLPGRLITWGVTSASGLEPCPGVSSSTNASVTLTPLSGTTDIDGRSQTTATVNVLPLPDPGTAVVYATAEGEVGCATIEVSIL